ncbi:MAG: ABC transporter, permease protein (cluster 13, osmolytes) [uncultured Nocardioidaceae bacterium]|uniref:ABC transporter, permease protein (Cluster 13, osmolytes) n=1 Tax=uncultured Nocardioidaceae bacterium TaxID=253824 RepID=A0A6J4MWT1_9ACTN|nr:MAG: ABC transporter, permease protein (cluster 13, osmolytes) [uncultured Nocardioidaceae bacterium]
MPDEQSWYQSFWTYLEFTWEDLVQLTLDHVLLVIVAVALATVIGITLGVVTYRTDRPRELVLAVTGTFLTIPSLALFGLFIAVPFLGLGGRSVTVGLLMYGLLPIVRNTIVGLREVDAAVVESAQGMGMGRLQRLRQIELPLAWPVILTGMRVSTLVLIGIAAIGAYINGPGLGELIFSGLARIGSATALNQVLSGLLGVMVLAVLFDLAYVAVSRFTTSRGIR